MRLILLDSDESYLQSVRVVVSSQMNEDIEVYTASNISKVLELGHLFGPDSYLLIHETFIDELDKNEEYLKLCQNSNLAILTEGIINSSVINQFFRKIRPNVKDYDLNEYIIMKYQTISKLLDTIRHNYLNHGNSNLMLGHNVTHFISLFNPYCNDESNNWIETTLKNFPSQYKILLIHYDPYVHTKEKSKFNLSYLYTLIKRGKRNLPLIINELKESLTYNVDVISGPGNMLDIDCLSDEENKVFIHNLQKNLHYDYILFDFTGVHLTKHIVSILEKSSECILCTDHEDTQLSIIRQTSVKWNMMMNDITTVLKEVIMKDEK